VLAVVAAGAIAAALVLTGSSGRHRILHEALELRGRVTHSKVLHLRPSARLPHLSLRLLRKHRREPRNETPRRPTRAAPAGVTYVSSSTAASTAAASVPTSSGPTDFALFTRHRFIGADSDHIAEPYVAANAGRVLETWNWGSALSSDDGLTFSFVNPDTAFPASHRGFCCDQLAYYVPGWDLWVWLLQYRKDESGNILRLAVAHGTSAFDAARGNASTLRLFDLSPASLGWPASAWFDFNGISSTRQNFFVATNVSNAGYEGVVIRIPLSELAAGTLNLPDVRYWKTAPLQTPRLAQGAAGTMYFAAHVSAALLRVWSWPDGSDSIASVDVPHSPYIQARPFHCPRAGGGESSDWCEGLRHGDYLNDDTVLAGWVAKGRVGFAWDAAQDPAHSLPYPFVMAVEIDDKTMKRVDEPIIWSPDYAYQFPSIAPDARGDLGGLVLRGGGRAFESCTAVVRDSVAARARSGWEAYDLNSSAGDPEGPGFGDYLGVASSSVPRLTATGYRVISC
jgi:hypothetical protein